MTERGRQRSVDGCLIVLRGRGELFLAPKSFPSPPQTPPLSSKRAHKEPRKTCGREIFHQAALLYGSASCLRRENQEGQGNGNPAAYVKRDRGCRSVQACGCTGCVVVERQPFRTARRRCRLRADARPYGGTERDGDPLVLPHIGRAPGMHTERGPPKGSKPPCRRTPSSPARLLPKTQKGPLAGALVSFSLVRPEPDTVIGTTRRFQPWRELPSWLRAGGSVR